MNDDPIGDIGRHVAWTRHNRQIERAEQTRQSAAVPAPSAQELAAHAAEARARLARMVAVERPLTTMGHSFAAWSRSTGVKPPLTHPESWQRWWGSWFWVLRFEWGDSTELSGGMNVMGMEFPDLGYKPDGLALKSDGTVVVPSSGYCVNKKGLVWQSLTVAEAGRGCTEQAWTEKITSAALQLRRAIVTVVADSGKPWP